MPVSLRIVIVSVVSLLTLASAPISGVAGDCTFLGKDPLSLRDGQLLYLLQGSKDWLEVQPESSAIANQTVEFVYIIQERIDQRRSGVAIVKSGRVRQTNEASVAEPPIELVRNPQDADPEECSVPSSMTARVSANSYDDYHDHGLSVPDQSVLDSFHYPYAGFHYTKTGRYGSCKPTDSNRRDARSARTNLAQFSFNPAVVRGEAASQLVSSLSPTRAMAATGNLMDRRVEVQAYRVRTGFPSCVRFSIKVPAKAAFVRINDLEGLKQEGRYYVRSDEISWTLAR